MHSKCTQSLVTVNFCGWRMSLWCLELNQLYYLVLFVLKCLNNENKNLPNSFILNSLPAPWCVFTKAVYRRGHSFIESACCPTTTRSPLLCPASNDYGSGSLHFPHLQPRAAGWFVSWLQLNWLSVVTLHLRMVFTFPNHLHHQMSSTEVCITLLD